ncbi:hypothetical protein ES703_99416 [subsurface metagenome]
MGPGAVRLGRVGRGSLWQGEARNFIKEADMKETAQEVKVTALVLDYDFYPREQIQSFHVKQMVEAMEAGVTLPPIIVDRKSKRVVDGFHRVRAYQKLYGKDTTIPAILKTYKTETDMFADGIALNTTHGRPLTPYDKARCIARAEELKMEPQLTARALNMTPERLGELKTSRIATYKMKPVVLKRTMAHLAGEELTDEQYAYNFKAGGMNQTFFINQVIAMLEADTVDWEDNKVVSAFRKLHDLLDKAVRPVRV